MKMMTQWERINAIFAEADILEELIQLRLEKPGETRESAKEWAKEQVNRCRSNGEEKRCPTKPKD